MRTCYLHLGMPKTGSTSIQHSLHGYQGKSIEYARLPASNHGATVLSYFSRKPESIHALRFLSAERIEKNLKKTRSAFENSLKTDKSVIFSGERIVRQLGPKEFADMVSFFKDRFDRVEVIAYVRPISTFVGSQFQQQVKGQGKGTFEFSRPYYRQFFAPIIDNIERENLQLVRFDRNDLVGRDIIEDFAHRVGIKDLPKQKTESNKSLSAEAVGALYAFNKYSGSLLPRDQHLRTLRRIVKSLQGVGKIKWAISPELIEEHTKIHAEEIAWMEDVAGFDLKGEIKRVPQPVGSEQDLLRLADEFSAIKDRES